MIHIYCQNCITTIYLLLKGTSFNKNYFVQQNEKKYRFLFFIVNTRELC